MCRTHTQSRAHTRAHTRTHTNLHTHTHTVTHSLTHSLNHSLTNSLTHSLTHSPTPTQLSNLNSSFEKEKEVDNTKYLFSENIYFSFSIDLGSSHSSSFSSSFSVLYLFLGIVPLFLLSPSPSSLFLLDLSSPSRLSLPNLVFFLSFSSQKCLQFRVSFANVKEMVKK